MWRSPESKPPARAEKKEPREQAPQIRTRTCALIETVRPDSPAAKVGLVPGDLIVEIEGKPITVKTSAQMLTAMEKIPGPKVRVRVWRNGKEEDTIITRRYNPKAKEFKTGFNFVGVNATFERTEDGNERVFQKQEGVWKDINGVPVCAYEIERDIRSTSFEWRDKTYTGTRLLKFVLKPTQEGQTPCDILATYNPRNIPVIVTDEIMEGSNGFYDVTGPYIGLADAHVPEGLFTLIHELCHASQYVSSQFEDIKEWFGIDRDYQKESSETGFTEDRIFALQKDLRGLCMLFPRETVGVTQADIERVSVKDPLNTELKKGLTVHNLLQLPRWTIERDAEYGTLRALRQIRQEHRLNLSRMFTRNRTFDRTIRAALGKDPDAFIAAQPEDEQKEWKRLHEEISQPITPQSRVKEHKERIGATNKKMAIMRRKPKDPGV